MAFSTNIGSGGPPDGGMLVQSGTSIRQIVLDLRDMIVGDSESRWQEVTASSPTPSHLQTFASTINSGNVGDDNWGFNEQVTLYLSDDNSLSFSDPGARLIRFSAKREGIFVSALDTNVVENSRVKLSDWVFTSDTESQEGSLDTSLEADEAFWVNGDNNSGYGLRDSPTVQDYKFFYVLDDNFLYMNAYGVEKTTDFGFRGATFYYPEPPSNGTVSRDDIPFIFYPERFALFSPDGGVYVPRSNAFGVKNLANLGFFTAPGATDTQDRNIYSQIWIENGGSRPNFYFDSFMPHVRMVDKQVYPNIADDYDFPTVTLTGTDYFIGGGHDGDPLFAIRYN